MFKASFCVWSAGAEKWLDVQLWGDTAECLTAAKEMGYQVGGWVGDCVHGGAGPLCDGRTVVLLVMQFYLSLALEGRRWSVPVLLTIS